MRGTVFIWFHARPHPGRRPGSRLDGRENDGPEIERVPLSATHFLAPGWVAPVEFILDGTGRVTHVASLGIERVLFERLP